MERRQFIGLSAYLAATITLPVLESCYTNSGKTAIAEPSVLMRILDKKNIIAVGKKYIEDFPQENNKEQLTLLLTGEDSHPYSDEQLRLKLDKQCLEDFITDNTIVVNGWVLSRTEARQCALFTFLQS